MKRTIVSLVIVLAAITAFAQTVDSIPHHVDGYYGPNSVREMENILHLNDGSVMFQTVVGYSPKSHKEEEWKREDRIITAGSVLYRVSRRGGILLDTLFVKDSDPSYFLFAKNPGGNNNIRVSIVHDTVSGGSFLQIFPFDNDLKFDSVNEVFVPLSDTTVISYLRGYLINKRDELVLSYGTGWSYGNDGNDYDQYFACYGLDGTLKHETVIPHSSLPWRTYIGLGVFNESPLEYCWYGLDFKYVGALEHIVGHVFDSLMQYKESFTIPAAALHPENPNLSFTYGWNDCLLVDGEDLILGSRFMKGYSSCGACVVRFDKRTLEQKKSVLFNSWPSPSVDAAPIGLGKDSEGSFYFSYSTQSPMMSDKGQIAVVKMDADFNVKWVRYCLEPEGYYRSANGFTVLDDGGVAVGGVYFNSCPEVFFLIVSDDSWDLPEAEAFVRPYAYWPNPVQSELHLQYSPDVKPTQIELYDLQGRLVKTQRSGLESLNLQGLSAGTYTMRVTLEGGKAFSDKVIKE